MNSHAYRTSRHIQEEMSAWCFRWRPISDVDLRRLVPESLRRAFSKQYQRFKRTVGCHPSFIIKMRTVLYRVRQELSCSHLTWGNQYRIVFIQNVTILFNLSEQVHKGTDRTSALTHWHQVYCHTGFFNFEFQSISSLLRRSIYSCRLRK